MTGYRVNCGFSLIIEADDEDEASDLAYKQIEEEWGTTIARVMWYSDPEEVV